MRDVRDMMRRAKRRRRSPEELLMLRINRALAGSGKRVRKARRGSAEMEDFGVAYYLEDVARGVGQPVHDLRALAVDVGRLGASTAEASGDVEGERLDEEFQAGFDQACQQFMMAVADAMDVEVLIHRRVDEPGKALLERVQRAVELALASLTPDFPARDEDTAARLSRA